MTRRAALALAGLLAAWAPLASRAQDRPRIQPSRDVAVTYRVEGDAASAVPGGIPGALRLSWDAAGQRLRAEPEGRTQAVIVNLRAHTAEVVDTTLRSALTLPVRDADLQPLTLDGARLTRRGDSQVAGLPCTEWETRDLQDQATLTCFTDDGVLLQARHGAQVLVQATRVAYGALDPSAFAVPPSYAHEAPPAAPPGSSR